MRIIVGVTCYSIVVVDSAISYLLNGHFWCGQARLVVVLLSLSIQ